MIPIFNRFGAVIGYSCGNLILDKRFNVLGYITGGSVYDICGKFAGFISINGISGFPGIYAFDGYLEGYIVNNVIVNRRYRPFSFVEVFDFSAVLAAAGLFLLLK